MNSDIGNVVEERKLGSLAGSGSQVKLQNSKTTTRPLHGRESD